MLTAVSCLEVLFGRGDSDYPFWLLTVRVNILLFLVCAALVIAGDLLSARWRQAVRAKAEVCTVLALTAVAGGLRFLVASPNLLDYGGIAYSRLLWGYKGYFGAAQFFSLFYGLTARDIEHAIFFDRLAGTLTIPLVYVLCRRLQSGTRLWPATAAFLFAVYPLHVLFSASDALAVFSLFLAATAYAILAGAEDAAAPWMVNARYLCGFSGLALLTQVRYENVLLLIPPAAVLFVRRHALRLRHLVPPLLVSATFAAVYAYAAATSGLSYQDPIRLWAGLDMVTRHLVLNPFLAVPVLFIGTMAVWASTGWRLGLLAVLPWLGAFVLAGVTTNTAHSAARIYANWLILILPFAGYGFSLLWHAPWRVAKAVTAVALLSLGVQPFVLRDHLAVQYLEILEHQRFRALLATLPSSVHSIIVPDDAVMSRQPHSTLELFRKYAAILAGSPRAPGRTELVGLTEYLEHPQHTRCAPGACVFFFGLPCSEPDVYPVSSGQCQELLRTHRTSVLDDTTVVAAPFVDCSIYTGTLRERWCDPAMKPRRFTDYWIEE